MGRFQFDISIVLNLHNEANYLGRTLQSLEEAARYAQSCDISVELVVVLDRPTPATRAWVHAYGFSVFDGHQIAEVENGSLGLSRNDGIEIARGEYIATEDGDDLISYNAFVELLGTARVKGQKTIVFHEYFYGFGDNRGHIWRYFGTDRVSKLAFFSYHPYVSRIFAHVSLFDQIKYSNVALTRGFAYEDWHFDCEAIRLGYEFAVAENTMVFYRLRPGSLLQNALSISVRQIPYSAYFEPSVFTETCTADFRRFEAEGLSAPISADIKNSFIANEVCHELVLAAHNLDPAIDVVNVPNLIFTSNLASSVEPGAAYFRLCEQLRGQTFTDVVLLPFLKAGGGEKYVLEVLNALRKLDPRRRFLVLTGESCDDHTWIHRLPSRAVFLDLHEVFKGCSEESIDVATLRLIQAVAPSANIHFKESIYAFRFFRRFAGVLDGNKSIFYRFSEPVQKHKGLWVTRGSTFDFLSEWGDKLSLIITDNDVLREQDTARLDSLATKLHTLPLVTRTEATASGLDDRARRKSKLLWASRLDAQKRPDLLIEIASQLERHLPAVKIDVFGSPVLDRFDLQQFSRANNILYRGPFSAFDELPHEEYDALLYTSAFDGLPNIVLEAMSVGLPVIAPDVGGIAEVITPKTGFLIENDPDDTRLIINYIAAISRIYDGSADIVGVGRSGLQLIEKRHSETAFLRQVAAIFGVEVDLSPGNSLQI